MLLSFATSFRIQAPATPLSRRSEVLADIRQDCAATVRDAAHRPANGRLALRTSLTFSGWPVSSFIIWTSSRRCALGTIPSPIFFLACPEKEKTPED